ncbi:MAG TPA: hypothetical protein VFL86_25135 [Burkholderiaceae bacterium]|nr:hypothetical protein [Burkholderiaceae bacterium]
MLFGGIARRVVRVADSLVGHAGGGLGMNNVMIRVFYCAPAAMPAAGAIRAGLVLRQVIFRRGSRGPTGHGGALTRHGSCGGRLLLPEVVVAALAAAACAAHAGLELVHRQAGGLGGGG